MRPWIRLARGLVLLDEGINNVAVFGVDADGETGLANQAECLEQIAIGNPREAFGIGLEHRQLEPAYAAVDQARDLTRAVLLANRAQQGDVDDCVAFEPFDLALEHRARGD